MNDELRRMKHVLGNARAGFEPTSADRERVRRRLLAAAASGVASSLVVGGAAGSTSAGAVASTSLAVSSLKLFAGTVVVVVAGGAAVLSASSHAPPAVRAVATSSSSIPPRVAGGSRAGAAVSFPGSKAIGEERAQAAHTGGIVSEEPRRPARPGRAAAAPDTESRDSARAPSSSELGRELELLRQAREACAEHRAASALSILDALDRQFPRGSLLEERGALRVVANCQAGARERERAVTAFAARFPGSVYLPRLRRECLSEADAATGAATGFDYE